MSIIDLNVQNRLKCPFNQLKKLLNCNRKFSASQKQVKAQSKAWIKYENGNEKNMYLSERH